MADNTILPEGTLDGDTYASDDIAGVKFQRVKLIHGADGVNAGDVASGNPLPVSGTVATGGLTDTELRATAVPVSGTVTVQDGGGIITVDGTVAVTAAALPLPALASTSTKQSDGSQKSQVVDGSGNVIAATSNALHVNVQNASLTVASHAVTNAGVFATQVDGAALTSLQLADDVVYTDDTSTHATGTSKGTLFMAAATPTDTAVNANDIGAVAMTTDRKLHVSVQDALPAGTAAIGKLAANAGVTIGAVEVAAAQTLANVTTLGTITNAVTVNSHAVTNAGTFAVQVTPATSGGLTTYHLVAAGTTNATSVKGTAGQLYGWYIFNHATSMRKVAFHNTSGTPTAGASLFFSLPIPASSGANVFSETGIPFSSGIGITTVTGIADADSAAVTANDLTINLFYK